MKTISILILIAATCIFSNVYGQIEVDSKGGYFAINVSKQNTKIAEEIVAGFKTGLVVNGNYTAIGIGANYFVNMGLSDRYMDTAKVQGAYAYLYTEPILLGNQSFIHFSLPLSFGVGQQYYYAGADNKFQSSALFGIVTAGLELDIQIFDFFTVAPGIYYNKTLYNQKLLYDVEAKVKPEVDNTWHQPFSYGISLKFGRFGRKND